MHRRPVQSSNVTSIGYDVIRKVLEVEFTNGGVYQYMDVPNTTYMGLTTAPSIGSFIAKFIKPTYKAIKLSADGRIGIRDLVGQSIGEASMCWKPTPTGVFDSDHAVKVIDEVLEAVLAELTHNINYLGIDARMDMADYKVAHKLLYGPGWKEEEPVQ